MAKTNMYRYQFFLLSQPKKLSNYPSHIKFISELLHEPQLLTTLSINRLEKYRDILLNDKPSFKAQSQKKQQDLKKAFSHYIEFIKRIKGENIFSLSMKAAA